MNVTSFIPQYIQVERQPLDTQDTPIKELESKEIPSSPPSQSLTKKSEVEMIRRTLLCSHELTLWEILDAGRQIIHSKALKNEFLLSLFAGGFCPTAFMKYLVNLLPIHEALEKAQQIMKTQDHLKDFVMPELFRSQRLKQDLVIWTFVSDQRFVPWKPCEEAISFAEHILNLSKKDPEALVGTLYALYGTIMSGGQINKVRVEEKLAFIKSYTENVPEGLGVAFYEINKDNNLNYAEVAEFKKEWHLRLSKVQCLRPLEKMDNLHDFHVKLKNEVIKSFEAILEIIKKNVELHHC